MIVEDDEVWMKCLTNFIEKEDDLLVVKKAYNKEQAIDSVPEMIDVVLLDLTLNDDPANLSGLEVASQLKEKGINRIIMLTSWDEEEVILKAFDEGAMNYVNKTSYRDIPKVVREAFANKVSIHPDVSSVVINALTTERKISVLTPSERQVYTLKEKGLNKVQIADVLFKSVETIKKQLKKINDKIR
ncbi:LuxR family transcriptional regulator [Bacillus thuringiensis serovar mexicanensis]|uniref:LuxR family transcriptional regulator n=2 Tax=Bacillus TaxID=1386 RepID=A0A242WAW5_BACTU|nr:Two component transcriptional regulator, LuxR [Bacillus thuringiensis serovar monterrey BGSC 4AJ1]OTW50963.1 LuxR family transcriptional regulator [Bacillus thuringiensis serovar mexicanensis]OTX09648.1 LuxR family transcriptional regulator [Bacillus thuringiensis serovar monterrey]